MSKETSQLEQLQKAQDKKIERLKQDSVLLGLMIIAQLTLLLGGETIEKLGVDWISIFLIPLIGMGVAAVFFRLLDVNSTERAIDIVLSMKNDDDKKTK